MYVVMGCYLSCTHNAFRGNIVGYVYSFRNWNVVFLINSFVWPLERRSRVSSLALFNSRSVTEKQIFKSKPARIKR